MSFVSFLEKIRFFEKEKFIFEFIFREVSTNEYIIPLGQELKDLYKDAEMCHSLRSLQMESVRPQMKMTDMT